MAYFACPKAALTGTDQATRISIAKGLVSPTFTNFSGKQVLRGVVQLDVVSGRDTGYATGQSIQERLAAAGRMVTSATGGRFVYADQARRATAATSPASMTTQPAALYEGGQGTIKTSTTLGLDKKTIIIGLVGVAVIGFLVMR